MSLTLAEKNFFFPTINIFYRLERRNSSLVCKLHKNHVIKKNKFPINSYHGYVLADKISAHYLLFLSSYSQFCDLGRVHSGL